MTKINDGEGWLSKREIEWQERFGGIERERESEIPSHRDAKFKGLYKIL